LSDEDDEPIELFPDRPRCPECGEYNLAEIKWLDLCEARLRAAKE